MLMLELKSRLEETQNKSDAPREFEEAIADAFKFLGLEAQLIGGSGDTDVLLTANIGKESFKVSVDGKTSKSGKITDNQIDWLSLRDHRKKNQAEFVVVVGQTFAGGNLASRAQEHGVSLLKTEDLIRLLEAHAAFPATRIELKDLFSGHGDMTSRVDDLITLMSARRNSIKQFKTIVEEMHAVQDGKLGYFTLQSLVAREKLEDIEVEPEEIESILRLLELPFINGISGSSENEFLMIVGTNDLANIFSQISQILAEEDEEEAPDLEKPDASLQQAEKAAEQLKPQIGTKYFKWEISKNSVLAWARAKKPYVHHCPIEHFKTIIGTVISIFEDRNLINKDTVYSLLQGTELAPERQFKGHTEEYKNI